MGRAPAFGSSSHEIGDLKSRGGRLSLEIFTVARGASKWRNATIRIDEVNVDLRWYLRSRILARRLHALKTRVAVGQRPRGHRTQLGAGGWIPHHAEHVVEREQVGGGHLSCI